MAAADPVFKSRDHAYRSVTLASGLNQPWGMAFLPGNQGILITEKVGKIRIYREGLQPRDISGGPNATEFGQGGLLDIAVHPNFTRNGYVFFSYVGRHGLGLGTELARAVFADDEFKDLRILFKSKPKSFGGRHFGSRLVFDGTGHLFMTLGDRGNRYEAQNLSTHEGTVLRFTADGDIPRGNPFLGRPGALPEIYSFGHRNVQGAVLHPETGELWIHEHGPQGGDEVNIIRRGANYGWPVITYGKEYGGGTISNLSKKEGMEQPVVYWVPSIAPSGMTFYTGNKFPKWNGNLFVGALRGAHLRRVTFENGKVTDQEELLSNLDERIRDVRNGPDGYLYIITDSSNGRLIRLEPASD
tara:strand:- start:59 stop:1129 length:1071 start_codon:yes stop_codon:yes gene_type:complete